MKNFIRVLLVLGCLLAFFVQPALAAEAEPASPTQTHIQFAPSGEPGMLQTVITGLPDDISSLICSVWCEDADRQDYTAARQEDGSWQLSVSSAAHGYRAGEYKLTAWTGAEDGSRRLLGTAIAHLQYAGGTVSAEHTDRQETAILLCLKDALPPEGAPVLFRVSSVQDPQNFQIYYAQRQNDGTYTAAMLPARHGLAGRYRIEAYIASNPVAFTETEVTGCTDGSVEAVMTDSARGLISIRASAEAPAGVRHLTAAVWAAPDRSDLVWYDMTENGSGWSVQTSAASHGHRFGTYNVHVYADLENGLRAFAVGASFEFAPAGYVFAERLGPGQYAVNVLGTGLAPGTAVQLPTWSAENGQDDLYWYTAQVAPDGVIRCPLDLSLHSAAAPALVTHVYRDGQLLASAAYDIPDVRQVPPVEQELNRYCRAVFDEAGRDLHSVYLWTVENLSYTALPWRDPPAGYTRQQWHAIEGFTSRRGDCHTYSATFAELACRLGYDAEYVIGYVWSVRGVWATHGFVIVHQGGQDYICDPELQSVAKNPKDLFMQPADRTKAKYKW